jgi:hypothetical protein
MNLRYRRNESVVERRVRDEHILVPVMNRIEALDSLYTLNPTAACIWRTASTGGTAEEVVQELCREFEVTLEEASADAEAILGQMVEIGVLVPEAG